MDPAGGSGGGAAGGGEGGWRRGVRECRGCRANWEGEKRAFWMT